MKQRRTERVYIQSNPGISAIAGLLWLLGIIIADGFWSTFFAVIFPLWGWYLVAEAIFLRYLS